MLLTFQFQRIDKATIQRNGGIGMIGRNRNVDYVVKWANISFTLYVLPVFLTNQLNLSHLTLFLLHFTTLPNAKKMCRLDSRFALKNILSTNPKINKFEIVITCLIGLVSKSQELVDAQHQSMLIKYT